MRCQLSVTRTTSRPEPVELGDALPERPGPELEPCVVLDPEAHVGGRSRLLRGKRGGDREQADGGKSDPKRH